MTDDNKTTAEALAQALAAAGIKSHEVAVPLRITAMQTAEKAFYAVGAGNSTDWQELMQLVENLNLRASMLIVSLRLPVCARLRS